MTYILKNASDDNIEYLKKCKLYNIFNYANNLPKEEIIRIENYVNESIPKQIKDYKIIMIDNKIIGCVLVSSHEDGVLLDEIYIENNFRNKGIGKDIIKKILLKNKNIYLWVYKENKKAIKLYKELGFNIIEDTNTRYYMKYTNEVI